MNTMVRKSAKIVLGLFMVLSCMVFELAASPIACAGTRTAVIAAESITLNEQRIDNESAGYPFLVYRNITYVPMTYHLCRFLGLEPNWDNSTRTLSIVRTNTVAPLGRRRRTEDQQSGRLEFPKRRNRHRKPRFRQSA